MASIHAAFGQAEIAFGVKGGLNFATLNGVSSPSAAYSNSTGFHAGGYFLFKFTKIGIQPEIIFSKQGHDFSYSGSNYTSAINYINIPIMLKLYIAAGLNLQAGPQFGFLASSKGDVYNSATSGISTGQDLKNFVKSTDFSVGLGVGWDLPFGLNFTARYNMGLSDINKLSGGSVPSGLVSSMGTSEAKNQVFQLSAGFRLFKFGK